MSTTKKLQNDCFALPAGVDWTPLDDALMHLETSLSPIIETEALPINLTVGRILAGDLKAGSDSPPFQIQQLMVMLLGSLMLVENI